MSLLITIGTALSVAGILGLLACIASAIRARRAGLEGETMRARLQRLVGWNMGALALSMLGLMTVIVGLMLRPDLPNGSTMDIRQITPDYAVSGQIRPEDVAALKEAGYVAIIANRPDSEVAPDVAMAEIRRAADAAGLAFHANPITSGAMTEANVAAQTRIREAADGPVFAYCRSGMRSSQAWALGEAGERDTDEILTRTSEAGYDLAPLRPQIDATRN